MFPIDWKALKIADEVSETSIFLFGNLINASSIITGRLVIKNIHAVNPWSSWPITISTKLSGRKEDGPIRNWETPFKNNPIQAIYFGSIFEVIHEIDKLDIVYVIGANVKNAPIHNELNPKSSNLNERVGSK